MLKQINIINFAIFEDAAIEPGDGYNVITGESGAGKSVVVNALSLIRGARASREMIRTGKDSAVIEAVFELSENKKKAIGTDEDILVITRSVNNNKSSECRINGKIRSLGEIIDITEKLLDIHGQYENQALADSDNHLEYLDAFAGNEINGVLVEYKTKLREYNTLIADIIALSGSDSERERNKEIYAFQINEIDDAGLGEISERELYENWTFQKNAERYRNEIDLAYGMLNDETNSPYEAVSAAVKALSDIPATDDLRKIIEKLNEASYIILDSAAELRNLSEGMEFDPAEFERLGDTIDTLKKLKRKYGDSIEEILSFRDKVFREMKSIEDYEKNNREMLGKVKVLETELFELDSRLSQIRKDASSRLRNGIINELNDMGMTDIEFIVVLDKKLNNNRIGFTDFGPKGLETCRFLISLNKGLEPQELGKVASGGEMSRIMLAFKTVYTFSDETDTVVFDEIDSGLSGEASRNVAAKLSKLSEFRQILCITHLPQIAARAGDHFVVVKKSDDENTTAAIRKAEGSDEIIRLIAALTDGENLTEEGILHARTLYELYN